MQKVKRIKLPCSSRGAATSVVPFFPSPNLVPRGGRSSFSLRTHRQVKNLLLHLLSRLVLRNARVWRVLYNRCCNHAVERYMDVVWWWLLIPAMVGALWEGRDFNFWMRVVGAVMLWLLVDGVKCQARLRG
jgi:hypothetical protein